MTTEKAPDRVVLHVFDDGTWDATPGSQWFPTIECDYLLSNSARLHAEEMLAMLNELYHDGVVQREYRYNEDLADLIRRAEGDKS